MGLIAFLSDGSRMAALDLMLIVCELTLLQLEQAINRRFAHPRRLLRGRDQTPKIEEPRRGDVIGQPEHLRVETPQKVSDAVAEPLALLFQVLRHARRFPQFDHHRIERLQRAKAAWVSAQRVAEHLRIPTVILGASRREAVPEAIELLGIDRVNAETTLHQALDDRAVRHLDGHEDRLRCGSCYLEDPSRHCGQAFAAVSERARTELAAAGIRYSDVMGFRGPVDAHEPVALVLHRADPHAVGAAAMSTGPCTGAQGRRLPTGPSSRPLAGARVPPVRALKLNLNSGGLIWASSGA